MSLSPKIAEHVADLRFNARNELDIAEFFGASVEAFNADNGPPPGYVPNMISNRQPGAVNRFGNEMYRPGIPAIPATMADAVLHSHVDQETDRFSLIDLARTKPQLLQWTFEAGIVKFAEYFEKHFGATLVEVARARLTEAWDAVRDPLAGRPAPLVTITPTC